jgi:CHASE2 domain-containing sensor protein
MKMQHNTVTLQITGGDFIHGYTGVTVPGKELIQLSASPELKSQFALWKYTYQKMIKCYSKNRGATYHDNLDELIELDTEKCAEKLVNLFNEWLGSDAFSQTRTQISKCFNSSGENLLIIQTECQELWQLPWHKWNFIKEKHPNTEVVFSLYGQTSDNSNNRTTPNKARILAVFGNDEDLDLAERQEIKNLSKSPDINIELLNKPKYNELTDAIRNEWDIFYYSGHTKENTFLEINQGELEKIENFAEAFKNSKIKIAIFNSCDNLKIASILKKHNVSIPYLILMSEKVHDVIAAEFFKCFIDKYKSGKSFYQSVKIARGKIGEKERDYPCSSWLPVIVQDNSVKLAPTWHELYLPKRKRIGVGLGIGTLATIAIALIRFFGLLQTPELFIFDTMMRSKPSEEIDKHILIIENKGEKSNLHQSLSNDLLNKFLVRLENSKDSQPKVVGLDNYLDDKEKRDPNEHKQLISYIKDGRLVLVCKKGTDSSIDRNDGISAPPDSIVGFSDVVRDGNTDGDLIRRHLLKVEKKDHGCETDFSLSYVLANMYFDDNPDSESSLTSPNQDKLDSLVDARLISNNRGLYKINNISLDKGIQIFLNYRYNNSTIKPFQTKNIEELLKESDEEFQRLIKQKIILIGTTDPGGDGRFGDTVQTPYGSMRGIYLQAHMTSQLVNAVTENRALIWANDLGDLLIIWVLSAVGGIAIAMMCERSIKSICLSGGALILIMMPLLSAPFLLIFPGYLFPLVPVAASLLSTGILVGLCLNNPTTLKKVQNLSLPSK